MFQQSWFRQSPLVMRAFLHGLFCETTVNQTQASAQSRIEGVVSHIRINELCVCVVCACLFVCQKVMFSSLKCCVVTVTQYLDSNNDFLPVMMN